MHLSKTHPNLAYLEQRVQDNVTLDQRAQDNGSLGQRVQDNYVSVKNTVFFTNLDQRVQDKVTWYRTK